MSTRGRRWSLSYEPETVRPKGGQESLQQVVDFLAPAERPLAGPNRSRLPALEAEIAAIAEQFNLQSHWVNGAPRASTCIVEIRRVEDRARQLLSAIRDLNDLSLRELREPLRGLDPVVTQDRIVQEKRQTDSDAEIEALPNPDARSRKSAWEARLLALAHVCSESVKSIEDFQSKRGRGAKDKGGNTNWAKQELGDPKWGLVYDCLELYEKQKPETATTTILGDFHQFVMAVYELATAKHSTDATGFDGWVKVVVKSKREDRALEKREHELQELLWGETPPRSRARALRLKKELDEVTAKRKSLWRKYWPHVRI